MQQGACTRLTLPMSASRLAHAPQAACIACSYQLWPHVMWPAQWRAIMRWPPSLQKPSALPLQGLLELYHLRGRSCACASGAVQISTLASDDGRYTRECQSRMHIMFVTCPFSERSGRVSSAAKICASENRPGDQEFHIRLCAQTFDRYR